MKPPREPKLTFDCPACSHPYGRWRPRCPACGHGTPPGVREAALAAPVVKTRKKKQREARPDDCIFCQRKKAKDRCPHCSERVHRVCMQLHGPRCKEFQEQLAGAMNATQLEDALRRALR